MSSARCLVLLSSFAVFASASWSKAEVAEDKMQEDEEGFLQTPAVEAPAKSFPAPKPVATLSQEHVPKEGASVPKDLNVEMVREKEEKSWLTAVLVIVVIALSILFETLQSFLMRKLVGHPYMLIVVNGLFKELTLLGFVALVSTTLVKTGLMSSIQQAANQVFNTNELVGYEQSQELPELDIEEMFEEVHLLLFIITVVFILLVCWLLATHWHTKKFFEMAECKKTRLLKEEVKQLSLFSMFGIAKRWRIVQNMQYRIMRKEFFQPTSGTLPTQVRPATFKFSNYLGLCMAFNIVDMVEVPVSTWLVLMFLIVVGHPVMMLEGENLCLCMMLISVALFLMIVIQFFQCWRIFLMCLPQFTPSFYDPNPVGTKQERKKTTPSFYSLPPKRAMCPRTARFFCGTESPTKHEQCFYFWKYGPAWHSFIMRMHVFLSAVFIGVYVKIVTQDPWLILDNKLLLVLQWVPFFVGQIGVWPNLIFFGTIISSTGMFRQDKAMNLTIQQQLEEKYSRYFLLIYELNTLAHIKAIKYIMFEGRDIHAYAAKYVRKFHEELPEDEQKQIEEIYHFWDDAGNKNGKLDMREFTNLLKSTGLSPEFSQHLARHWFRSGVLRLLPRDFDVPMTGTGSQQVASAYKPPANDEKGSSFRSSVLIFEKSGDLDERHRLLEEARSAREDSWNFEDSVNAAVPGDRKGIPRLLRTSTRALSYAESEIDEISLTQFKMLYMIMRDIELTGTSEENLYMWFSGELSCIGRDDYILGVEDWKQMDVFCNVGKYCGITTKEQIVQLFNVIANPADEDEVTEQVHIRDFTNWICKMMAEQSGSRQQAILIH